MFKLPSLAVQAVQAVCCNCDHISQQWSLHKPTCIYSKNKNNYW